MNTSLFELFKIGIGPSSSHTVGPMRAALAFLHEAGPRLPDIHRVLIDLYGSLALTGIGHGTDHAVLAGLSNQQPDTITPESMASLLDRASAKNQLLFHGDHPIEFLRERDLLFHRDQMFPAPEIKTHPNGMRFTAFDATGEIVASHVYFSIGGGFVIPAEELSPEEDAVPKSSRPMPFPFRSAEELLKLSTKSNLTIAELMFQNEVALAHDASILRPRVEHPTGEQDADKVRDGILALWSAMRDCAERGMRTGGILPGGLNVRRRAQRLSERLKEEGSRDPLAPLDWLTIYAMAVNEENAAGSRVVTAPTNGAAGVIPAIGLYYLNFIEGANDDGIVRYFLTAAAIGILYKENASISGAEVGCQGEVGVACSMAAGGLVAALGGTNAQVEHAAEIGMEHNLGMTCDPIGGLVQIPCIERNAMGAVKAVNAARMAMHETDEHKVSLDQVIRTMYQTGLDMQSRYKETSLAGLALNVIEC
ncbi:L-serine ammonia-lyase [Terriglobus saanensis]|uniref:L-serine dehydratase n=1 Tax=Terriglobus saanensis (strain ATCC BAA-1853 / DSM 23119 / SP1PR4) TaxID=401053 RepID=E8V6G6_TERSS|nr:L-serine ammonia-lyase [Terriglobus saanensis]ADV81631.1 L-serine dehydratase 1 [Terriglobus saanensis SP1PR4]